MIIETLVSHGYLGILLLILLINLIPFASPSNLVLAGAVVYFTSVNPAVAALVVAAGATLGKLVHFYFAMAFGKRVNYSNGRLSKYNKIVGRWGAFGAFVAAATPIPDDPIVIPLGLMRYNVLKFATPYFLGKLAIALLGAYAMKAAAVRLETLIGNGASIVGSAILSVLAITILLKIDPSRIRGYVLRLRGKSERHVGNPEEVEAS